MLARPSKAFGVSRHGVSILEAVAGETVKTGIGYTTLIPGFVPPYEEYDAMVEANYTEAEWETLNWETRAKVLAHYRLARLIELHQNDAVSKKMKQMAKKH